MRRFRERRPATFFRGGELPRLLALITLLIVIGMMMARARDPDTWGWLTGEGPRPAVDAAGDAAQPQKPPPAKGWTRPVSSGPTDRDQEEIDAAREEFQAVADGKAIRKEEIPAYWRLMQWADRQTFESLYNRAQKKVRFGQFYEKPSRLRGQLYGLRLHLKQAFAHEELDAKAAGFDKLYELRAWNSESQPNVYILVVPSVPKAMPLDLDLKEEIRFAGYFYKLMAVQDHEGKFTQLPVLIGRMEWIPSQSQRPTPGPNEWMWPWLVGGVLVVLFLLRWGGRLFLPRRAVQVPPTETIEGVPIETWLEQSGDESPTSQHAFESSGNGRSPSDGESEMLDGRDASER